MPKAWKIYQRKEKDFRREVREAARFFRALFPFLPKREKPESVERLGVWLPPMLKIAKEVESEMGLGGGQHIIADFQPLLKNEDLDHHGG